MSSSFLQILFLGALWGAAFMFMRVAVPEFGAFSMALARVAMAAIIMLAIVAALRQSIHFRARWKTYLAVGAINTALPFIAYSFAAKHIPAGYSAIANSTTPVWSALITWLWFKQPLGAAKWIGIVFAFAGVFVLVGLQPVALTPLVIAGMVSAVLAASMYAAASFLIQRYLTGESGLPGAAGMLWGATMWLIAPGLFYAPEVLPTVNAWGAVLALSVLCTVLGYGMFFHLIKTIGPQRASSVAFLFPAFAAFWGWLILSEPITFNMIAGMALVLVGTALVSMSASKTGPTTTWERLRDAQVVPFLFAALPPLRRPIANIVSRSARLYRNEADAVRQHARTLLPDLTDTELDAAVADHRFTRLTDHADMWIYKLWGARWYDKHVVLDAKHDGAFEQGFYLGYHFGGSWWIAAFLRERNLPTAILFWDSAKPQAWVARLMHHITHWRVNTIGRLLGVPQLFTNTEGVSWQIIRNWRNGVSLIAMADVPPPLVDRTCTVEFFDRPAEFPPSLIELALRQKKPIYMFKAEWDRVTMRPIMQVREVVGLNHELVLQDFVDELESMIRRRPGAWHLWGDATLFFRQS